MKVYTKIVYDKDDNIIEEHSYNYNGPVSQANAAKQAAALKARQAKIRASKKATNAMDDAMLGNIGFSDAETVHDMQSYEPGSFDHPDKGQHLLEPSYDNPLHKFASYNTIFTLSGLGKDELSGLSYLNQYYSPHEIIARSGGISDANVSKEKFDQRQEQFRKWAETSHMRGKQENQKYDQKPSFDILSAGHDIFFEDVNIISTVGPNPERGLANFTKMEFELHEPFGVTLVEKMRASAFINGFKDYQDAPFLLTIQWMGNVQPGGGGFEPMSLDPITHTPKGDILRKIPVVITRVEFDVDQGGAKYSAVAVTYGDLAMDDRFNLL